MKSHLLGRKEMQESPHYVAIRRFYGGLRAERERVPYINHINEGPYLLERLGASRVGMEAFYLHPMIQGDAELSASLELNPSP